MRKRYKNLQLCIQIALQVRWKDFKYERSGTAPDKMYFNKFLNEVWEQLIQISTRSVLGGRW